MVRSVDSNRSCELTQPGTSAERTQKQEARPRKCCGRVVHEEDASGVRSLSSLLSPWTSSPLVSHNVHLCYRFAGQMLTVAPRFFVLLVPTLVSRCFRCSYSVSPQLALKYIIFIVIMLYIPAISHGAFRRPTVLKLYLVRPPPSSVPLTSIAHESFIVQELYWIVCEDGRYPRGRDGDEDFNLLPPVRSVYGTPSPFFPVNVEL